MVKKLVILILVLPLLACAAEYTSTQSGMFDDVATWGGSGAPTSSGDSWTISSGHTVYYDYDNSSHANGWGASVVNGTLQMLNSLGPVYLKMNGNISGTGEFLVGAENDVITNYNHLPRVTICFKSGRITMSKRGGIKWYGATNGFHGAITNTVSVSGDRTNLFFLDDVVGVESNDVVFVDNHNIRNAGGSVHVVYSVATNRITLFDSIVDGAAVVTNYYPGISFTGGVTTNDRTNGTTVTTLSRPVVVMQNPKISNTAILDSLDAGYVQGTAVANAGYGFLSGRSFWSFDSCSGIGCSGASLVYGTSLGTIRNSVSYSATGTIPIANDSVGCTISNSIGASANLVANMYDSTIIASKGINVQYGAIGINCYSTTFEHCHAMNADVALYGLRSCNVRDCTAGNVNYLLRLSVVDANNFWATNTTYLGNRVFGSIAGGENRSLSSVDFARSSTRDTLRYNGTNFIGITGYTYGTNVACPGSEWCYTTAPAYTNQPVASWHEVGLKASATREIPVRFFATNNVGYAYGVSPAGVPPIDQTYLDLGGVGWVERRIPITNTLPVPMAYRLTIMAYATNAQHRGYYYVEVPTDYAVRVLGD